MNNLRDRLIGMSTIVAGVDERQRIRSALFIAAEATLARIREVNADKFDLSKTLAAVENELYDDGSRSAMVPPKLYRAETVAEMPSTKPELL